MSNKLISFLTPTRKRVIFLKNSIESILKNVVDESKVEMIFRLDDDDEDTTSCIKSLPFDNLYINGKKMEYEKNYQYDKLVDMHFIIGPRGNGYQDLHYHVNDMYKISTGKWLFLWSDDVEILSKNWDLEVERLDSLNKVLIAKLTSWNLCLIPREIPDLWGYVCSNQWIDLWYDEIAKQLDLYEESNIEIYHDRVMGGSTADEREHFFRAIERSPNWVNNTWLGGPPSYDAQMRDEAIIQLKKYIESKNMNDINTKFSNKLDNFFNSLDKKTTVKTQQDFVKKVPDTIVCNFVNGPFVEILGTSNTEYTIEFLDMDTNIVVHREIMTPQHWTRANRQWFTNWKIKIYTTELVYEHTFNVKDKKVYVHLSSESIGDTLAWFPYVEEFRKKHDCRMVCSTFHNYLFEENYKDIEFVKPGTQVFNLYAMYEIGIYDGNYDRNKIDHKEIPLQKVSADMLGLEYKEIRPNITVKKSPANKIYGKYVVIATESTAQCKFWNYPDGWQKVVDYLNKLGYRTVVVQKSKSNLKNIIDKTGNKDLNAAIDIINGAEFMIGISSGLSWISWALQKKTIMISGFTLPWHEFNENCYRVLNVHSCKGCWHKHVFDKGDWNWCPMKKNFECSSTILPENVFAQIETIINNLDVAYTPESPNTLVNLTNKAIGFKFNDSSFEESTAIFYEIFRNRVYDFNPHIINENDVVLDIGANIGLFTRYARARRAKTIYSFEPIRENYDLFVKNNNDLPASASTVISHNVGISDKHNKEIFYLDSNSGGHTILNIDVNNSRTKETREIECYSLDYMFENKIIPDKIDFMKIDAEGAEIKIFDGISNENLSKIDKIAMEWHQFLFKDKSAMNSLIDRLVALDHHFYIDYIGNDCITLYFWKP